MAGRRGPSQKAGEQARPCLYLLNISLPWKMEQAGCIPQDYCRLGEQGEKGRIE